MSGLLLAIGNRYGDRYTVTQFLGEGGMQQVYLATDAVLQREVALKVPKNSAATRRFRRSAVLSSRVNHPNAAKTLDYFEAEGRFYLVEELIKGITLAEFRHMLPRIDPYAVSHVLHHLAKGVAASHHVNVVHRDIKPSNIMVDSKYRLDFVKITDFGIAKMTEEALGDAAVSEETMTSSHTMMGALPYLSPEMIKTPKEAGFAADIWAIGAVAFELLSGKKPFGSGLTAVPTILAADPPEFPSALCNRSQFRPLAEDLYNLIMHCLKKDPTQRPRADELVAMCEKLCYQTHARAIGRVNNYPNQHSAYGFIVEDGTSDLVFFHTESVYGEKPRANDLVWFSKFLGDPRDRAHPVVPMSTKVGGQATR
jgi:eukaryotic-like serine/threonine-protein kinase